MKINTFSLAGILFFCAIISELIGQNNYFTFYPSNLSASMLGQAKINGEYAVTGDSIAAFDPQGHCAGAAPIIINQNQAFFNLVIYGDDPNTTQDEGMLAGENFTLRLKQASNSTILIYPTTSNPQQFSGWVNNNGAPIPGYSDPNVMYNFIPAVPLSGTASLQHPSCSNGTNGSITLAISGGTQPYTYSWSNGSSTNPLTAAAGQYSVTVTDQTSAVLELGPFTLTAPAPVIINFTPTQPSCFGDSNGALTVNASGGSMPYTYLWNTNSTTQSINGLVAGSYSITVTDAAGCTKTGSFTLQQPTAISVGTTSTPATGGANNGTATATASGGTPIYTYKWSTTPTITTAMATGLAAGPYTVTVTDSQGCSQTASVTVENEQIGACTDWVNPSPTTGWTNFNDEFGGAPCNDGTGCPFYQINAFSVWASEAYAIDGFIQGGTYAFSMCNGTGAGSWIPDFTIIAPNGQVDKSGLGDGDNCTITWTASQSGTYLIVINEAGHCGGGSNLSTDNGWPAITCISNANCILPCVNSSLAIASVVGNSNGTATVNATGGMLPYTYLWSNGHTSQTTPPLPTGNYTVTVTDAEGCTVQGSTDVVSGSTEIDILEKLEISPNPSTGRFALNLQLQRPKQVCVALYNITGSLLSKTDQYGSTLTFQFDLSANPAGIYLMKTTIGEETIHKLLHVIR